MLIDLHAHILPKVDDGPQKMDDALDIVRALSRLGFTHLFATPHYRHGNWAGLETGVVIEGVRKLRQSVAEAGLRTEIYPGMEYDLDHDLEEQAAARPDGAGHVLVDPGFYHVSPNMTSVLTPLVENGLKVILVHPERNGHLTRNGEILTSLVNLGIRFLGNIGSLGGMYGRTVKRNMMKLLERDLYWGMATDIHFANQVFLIEAGMNELEQTFGSAATDTFFRTNPREIVEKMEANP
ncbi:MAG: hypothetical protein JSV26_07840 [bacterium]|nr:MAG: hypothetical protein JSV26_07840 [bacterium]